MVIPLEAFLLSVIVLVDQIEKQDDERLVLGECESSTTRRETRRDASRIHDLGAVG